MRMSEKFIDPKNILELEEFFVCDDTVSLYSFLSFRYHKKREKYDMKEEI